MLSIQVGALVIKESL